MRDPYEIELPPNIRQAIRSGPVPVLRDVDLLYDIDPDALTLGERVIAFAHQHLKTPEGLLVGKPLQLDPYQQAFIIAIFDNPVQTHTAVLSVGRRNGKTLVLATLMLAYLIGPLAGQHDSLASAAQSRDQAALIFALMSKTVALSDDIQKHLHMVPSKKHITSIPTGSEYFAMSADAKTGFGRALRFVVLDESGQIRGESSEYVSMLETSQGSFEDPLFVTISTQAPSDQDWLSITIDDAVRSGDPHTVAHVYEADKDCDLMDEEQWHKANPGLGKFRSLADMRKQMVRAARLPSREANARNLLLNQRVAQVGLWLAPTAWRDCGGPIDESIFRDGRKVSLGLDLSARQDLTAAVLAAMDDDGAVHLKPYVFCPTEGIEERAKRDRTPYDTWVREGHMVPLGGRSMDYQQICEYLAREFQDEGIDIEVIAFDRWRIEDFQQRAEEEGLAEVEGPVEWLGIGQGYHGFSPPVTAFESLLLDTRIRHGNHPLLTMGAANAIAVENAAGEKKLDKSRATARIDPLVAAVMAVYCVSEKADNTEGPSVYENEAAVV